MTRRKTVRGACPGPHSRDMKEWPPVWVVRDSIGLPHRCGIVDEHAQRHRRPANFWRQTESAPRNISAHNIPPTYSVEHLTEFADSRGRISASFDRNMLSRRDNRYRPYCRTKPDRVINCFAKLLDRHHGPCRDGPRNAFGIAVPLGLISRRQHLRHVSMADDTAMC